MPNTVEPSVIVDTLKYAFYHSNRDTSCIRSTTDGGQTWRFSSPIGYPDAIVQYQDDTLLYVDFNQSVRQSTDFGVTWSNLSTPVSPTADNYRVHVINHRTIVVLTGNDGVYVSTNFGMSWSPRNSGLPILSCYPLFIYDSTTFYMGVTNLSGFSDLYKTTDAGVTWSVTSLQGISISGVARSTSGTIIAGSSVSYSSTDNGTTWNESASGITASMSELKVDSAGVYIARNDNSALLISTNEGQSWHSITRGLHYHYYTYSLTNRNGEILLGTSDGKVLRTIDYGNNWTTLFRDTDSLSPTTPSIVKSVFKFGNNYYVFIRRSDEYFCFYNAYQSTDDGVTWHRLTGLENDRRFPGILDFGVSNDNKIYCIPRNVSSMVSGVGISTDLGNSWSIVPGTDSLYVFQYLASISGDQYVLGQRMFESARILHCSPLDTAWLTLNSGSNYLNKMYSNSTNDLFFIVQDTSTSRLLLRYSTNQGTNWNTLHYPSDSVNQIREICLDPRDYLYLHVANGTLYRSIYPTFVAEHQNHPISPIPSFRIFPNPCNSSLTIRLNTIGGGQIVIYNLLGQHVSSFSFVSQANTDQVIQVNLNELSSGRYYLSVIDVRSNRRPIPFTVIK
ncbi:MAG: T9SS type A sorting domain-containing protein [bacterium]|nr:T9SS type A sorting domain-containing protein [bacterium]